MSNKCDWKIVSHTKKCKKHKTPPKTFLLSCSAGLDYSKLKVLLCNWTEINVHDVYKSYVDFIYVDGNCSDKKLFNVRSKLKSILNDEKTIITDKSNLYYNLEQSYPEIAKKYLSVTRSLHNVMKVDDNDILIVKPVGRGLCAGKHITRVTNNEELEHAKEITKRYSKCIAVNYIKNPLLMNGKKFHVRSYMLITTTPYMVSLFNRGKIFTAKMDYICGDYNNSLIHDTHLSSTSRNIYFPEELDVDENIKKVILLQMAEIVHYLGELMRTHAKPYPESSHAFEVFGLDFLIADSYRVILMEVNDKIGLKCIGEIDEKYSQFSKEYFEWIYENAIKTVFDK